MMDRIKRVRVNLSTSVKGVVSFDCTVEITDDAEELTWQTVAAEAEECLAHLQAKYPNE